MKGSRVCGYEDIDTLSFRSGLSSFRAVLHISFEMRCATGTPYMKKDQVGPGILK